MDIHNSATDIRNAYINAPDATEALEGPNEDDADAGATIHDFMQLLRNTVHGNPATAAMPIIGPSFTQPSSSAAQGNTNSLISSETCTTILGTAIQRQHRMGAGSTVVEDMAGWGLTCAWRR
jgi:hypothetical protein